MKITKYLGFIAIILGITAMPFFSHAQEAGNRIGISPLTFELTANPGETITNVVRVTNDNPHPITARIEVEDFAPAGERGEVRLERDNNYTYSLAKWITVTPIEFVIEPGQYQSVEFTVRLPENAEPGGHYGSVLASVTGSTSAGAAIAQKVGSLVLLQVSGDIKEEMHINSMSVSKAGQAKTDFFEYGPVKISTRFENTGTVHLKPRGFILVKNMFGREVAKLDMPQQNVLPDSIRRIDVDFGDKWMFGGKYTATFTGIYGSTNEPMTYTTSFWVIPWKVGGAVLAGVLLLLIFFWKARKRFSTAFKVLFKGA